VADSSTFAVLFLIQFPIALYAFEVAANARSRFVEVFIGMQEN